MRKDLRHRHNLPRTRFRKLCELVQGGSWEGLNRTTSPLEGGCLFRPTLCSQKTEPLPIPAAECDVSPINMTSPNGRRSSFALVAVLILQKPRSVPATWRVTNGSDVGFLAMAVVLS